MPLFLGIDIGTTGVRACAIDSEAVVRARSSCDLPAPERQGAQVTQDAELWWKAVLSSLHKLLAQVDRRDVRSISIDGTSSTLLITDAKGAPIGPAIMYNDSRAAEQIEKIAQVAPAGSAARGSDSALARLLLLQKQPEARHALHQADWVAGRFVSRFGFSDENNALKLGYDPLERCWPDWLSELDVHSVLLPEVFVPGTPVDQIDPLISSQLNLRRDVILVAGTTDGVAAFLSTGADKAGDAVTSLGSTLVVKVLCATPISSPNFGIYSHRLGNNWLAGGASNSGGGSVVEVL